MTDAYRQPATSLGERYFQFLKTMHPERISIKRLYKNARAHGYTYEQHQAAVRDLEQIVPVAVTNEDGMRHFAYANLDEETEKILIEQLEMFDNWE